MIYPIIEIMLTLPFLNNVLNLKLSFLLGIKKFAKLSLSFSSVLYFKSMLFVTY